MFCPANEYEIQFYTAATGQETHFAMHRAKNVHENI